MIEAETMWAAALGWMAGAIVIWRYMLRVCDQGHAKVLQLKKHAIELEETLFEAEDRVRELEGEK